MDRFTALVISTVVSVWMAAPEDEVSAMCAGVEAASAGVQAGVRALVYIHTAGVGVPGVANLDNRAVKEHSRSFTVPGEGP